MARVRRIAGTRKVGHAGTLDPMATGVLVLGVERATRLLGHLALTDKAYDATVRLGARDGHRRRRGRRDRRARRRPTLTGERDRGGARRRCAATIEQRPSAVSAVKVDGVRSYARVRAGEDVELPARRVTRLAPRRARRCGARGRRPAVRRRRRVGDLLARAPTSARSPATSARPRRRRPPHRAAAHPGRPVRPRRAHARSRACEADPSVLPLADAVGSAFDRADVDAATAAGPAPAGASTPAAATTGLVGVFGPDGARAVARRAARRAAGPRRRLDQPVEAPPWLAG